MSLEEDPEKRTEVKETRAMSTMIRQRATLEERVLRVIAARYFADRSHDRGDDEPLLRGGIADRGVEGEREDTERGNENKLAQVFCLFAKWGNWILLVVLFDACSAEVK